MSASGRLPILFRVCLLASRRAGGYSFAMHRGKWMRLLVLGEGFSAKAASAELEVPENEVLCDGSTCESRSLR